jgi:hypothetical protein
MIENMSNEINNYRMFKISLNKDLKLLQIADDK